MFDLKIENICREKVAVAMGAFDGIHRGHQFIINKMIDESKILGIHSAVYTFNNVPKSVKNSNESMHILKARDKYEILKDMGVDIVYMHDFDEKLMNTSPVDFIENLYQYFDIKVIVVGKDFKFGYKAEGNVKWLEEQKNRYGYKLIVSDFYEIMGKKVSSTSIRKLLRKGDTEEANLLLGRNHFVKGKVIDGRKMGRKIGFPTANTQVYAEMAIISNGVYYTKTNVLGRVYDSVTNIGNVPSFYGAPFSVETHILDFDGDIYGKDIKVEFIKKLRNEVKFETTTELVEQIHRDVKTVRELTKSFIK